MALVGGETLTIKLRLYGVVVIVGLIGGLTAVTIAYVWVTMRLMLYGVKADSADVAAQYAQLCRSAYRTTVAVFGLWLLLEHEIVDGVVHGFTDLTAWILTLAR